VTTRLLLIVHAATSATRAARFGLDEELDEGGRVEAAGWAGSLPGRDSLAGRARLSCGHALRCRQTAQVLRDGTPPGEDALDGRLDDWNLGSWAGRALPDVAAENPAGTRAWLDDPEAAPHGGESLAGLLLRVGRYFTDLATHPGHHIAITHPAFVRAAVVHALRAPPAAFWRVDVFPLTRVAFSANAGRWNLRFA